MKGFSFWELQTWFNNVDYCIIGSGIVGLNCALSLREQFPKAKIIVLDKGILPKGASTKNAGFSCFGSISEIIADLKSHSQQEVIDLVQKRWDGVNLLRKRLGEAAIGYQQNGGYEVFFNERSYEEAHNKLSMVNQMLQEVFPSAPFEVYSNKFNFENCASNYIGSSFEGQINTGELMKQLLFIAHSKGIQLLYGIACNSYTQLADGVEIHTTEGDFKAAKMLIATNGFASQMIEDDIQPARAQVMITKPIENFKLKGVFHMDEGYYYFRNVEDRILIGGARNEDFKAEETTSFETTDQIINKLHKVLSEIILPQSTYEIDCQWAGIMGVGKQKGPIVKALSNDVYCGVRLGGMGVAIGSAVGAELASLTY
jgi:glycine/D-amino acid oxidase-like deaminating enzyme